MREEKTSFLSKKNMVALFIIIIMVLSAAAVVLDRYSNSSETQEYKKIKFSLKNSGWSAQINEKEHYFDYLPQQVEGINMSKGAVEALKGFEIDFTYASDDRYKEAIAKAGYDFEQNLGGIYIRNGMTDENEFNATIITCRDATAAVPVIYFKRANATGISYKDNCITAEAESEADVARIKDRLLYGIMGIIE